MDKNDQQRVEQFLGKWLGSEGNERANYQGFFLDLCDALSVEKPPPKGDIDGDPYCFDKDIKAYSEKGASTKFADFYKEGCFLIEAKQGSTTSGKGHGKRGTKAYRDTLQKAFNQARAYARSGSLSPLPPFLMTCDIGSHFEVWEGFSGEYGSYGARTRINLNDVADPKVFDRFVKIFTDPQALNPEKERARVTREVAAKLAKLSRWLEEQGHNPQDTAQFLMRCIFTMFAEDVELLNGHVFTKALRERWIPNPRDFKREIENLWQTMNTGGTFGFERILKFNGSFFQEATAFDLPTEQLDTLYEAAAKDWSKVEPAIFGTLVERALDKKERSKLGAHYTPRSYVERLVKPVVMEPLRQEWEEIEIELKRLLEPDAGKEEPTKNQKKKAEQEIRAFLEKLRTVKILDPACGTGNFLYVSLDLLKGLEQEVATRLVDVAGDVQLGFEQINPSQFLGIEINPRAAAIAELVIWIGYLQWYFKRYGTAEPPEPVLQAFGNIENRDAVLTYDGKEPDIDAQTGEVRTRQGDQVIIDPVTGEDIPNPENQVTIYRYLNPRPTEWPEANYVVSNPPFIGDKKMKSSLGDGYSKALRAIHFDVPEMCDYVMYWWDFAAKMAIAQKYQRIGFITTNSIKQTFNRRVLKSYLTGKKQVSLFFAIPDHPWVDTDSSAAVRIAMTGFELSKNSANTSAKLGDVISENKADTPEDEAEQIKINWQNVGKIFSDLRHGANVSASTPLKANQEIISVGVALHGQGFVVPENTALEWIENNHQLKAVIRSTLNGRDLTDHPRKQFVIDFFGKDLEGIKDYQLPYQWILERVLPTRKTNNRKSYREFWWIFGEPRPKLRQALAGTQKYIVTPLTAKHRFFTFLDIDILPDQSLVTIALEDFYFLGALSSCVHVCWALAAGGRLGVGNDPRYNKTRCFDPFPFPNSTLKQKQTIRDLGERLDTHRKQVQAAHPDITITGMYNLLEKLRAGDPFTDKDREFNNKALVSTLKQIHDELDIAVLDAYGWPHNITDEQILENLVALNAERAEEERNGYIRWLRPEYQAPDEVQPEQPTLVGILEKEEPIIEPVEQQKWPTKPKDQLAAIRDLLRTTPGEWTVKQIAAQFKGRNTQKKLDAINENLERLEWFGLVIKREDSDPVHWSYAESTQVA